MGRTDGSKGSEGNEKGKEGKIKQENARFYVRREMLHAYTNDSKIFVWQPYSKVPAQSRPEVCM